MRRALIAAGLSLGFLLPGSATRADGLRASINRPEIAVTDQLVLTLTVEGSRKERPQLPDLPDFEVYPRGQSTQMSFINGQMTSSISFTYALMPKRPGTFTIGPATVDLDGEVYSSDPIEVRVVEANEQPEEARDLFVSAKVSTTRAYVGQEVLFVWRFYRRVRIGDARLEPWEFRGFLVEDLGEVREYQATVDGLEYLVSEIRKSLFPQEVGELTIPASRLTLEVLVRRGRSSSRFDDFFGRQRTETKVLRSRPIDIEILPLPEPPAEFSGLVGEFDIDASISKAVVQAGESTTLKLFVSGSGNVQMISEPSLPELPEFKIYDDRPVGATDRSGARLTGSRTFGKALVPLTPGHRVIPPIELVYFDPDQGTYQRKQTAAIALEVLPAEGAEDLNLTESVAPTTGKVAVRVLADDLLPIDRGAQAVGPPWIEGVGRWALPLGLFLPPLVFLVTWSIERRRHRFATDVSLRRRHRALRRLRRSIRKLSTSTTEIDAASRTASKCLRRYIGDKLGLEGGALTSAEIDRALQARGVEEGVVRATHSLLARLEASHYGGDAVDATSAIAEIESLAARLEREL